MKTWFQFVLVALMVCASPLLAQEVGYLNLLGVKARTRLRAPAPPPPVCKDGVCSAGGSIGSAGIGCGAGALNEPRALKTTLVSLDRFSYTPEQQAEVEIKIENAGSVDMTIPLSPHLADLQPADETLPFNYSSLSLSMDIEGLHGRRVSRPTMDLYGRPEVEGSLITLKPGEWIRVRVQTSLAVSAEKLDVADSRWLANVSYELQSTQFLPNVKDGGYGTSSTNIYPRQLSGPPVTLEIRKPEATGKVSEGGLAFTRDKR